MFGPPSSAVSAPSATKASWITARSAAAAVDMHVLRLVGALLGADHKEAARRVMANRYDAIDRGALDEAMARGNRGAAPHDDAMRDGCARCIGDDRAARRHRLDLGPQHHPGWVAARHAAGAVRAFSRRLEHKAAVEFARSDHSDSTR